MNRTALFLSIFLFAACGRTDMRSTHDAATGPWDDALAEPDVSTPDGGTDATTGAPDVGAMPDVDTVDVTSDAEPDSQPVDTHPTGPCAPGCHEGTQYTHPSQWPEDRFEYCEPDALTDAGYYPCCNLDIASVLGNGVLVCYRTPFGG